jgi:hypothetical protein
MVTNPINLFAYAAIRPTEVTCRKYYCLVIEDAALIRCRNLSA